MRTRRDLHKCGLLAAVSAVLVAGISTTAAGEPAADGVPPANTGLGLPAAKAAPAPSSPASYTSPWVDEVVRLSSAGIDDNVILAFVDAAGTFNLGSSQIISMREGGVSDSVLGAILAHDAAYLSGARQNPPGPPVSMRRLLVPAGAPPLSSSGSRRVQPDAPESAIDHSTIVHPSPAEEYEPWFSPDDAGREPSVVNNQSGRPFTWASEIFAPTVSSQPVRSPNVVPLTDTIRVYRTAWRTPNIQVVRCFSEGR